MSKDNQNYPTSKFKMKDGSVLTNTEPFRFKSFLEFLFHRKREYIGEYMEYYNKNVGNFKIIDNHSRR